MNKDKLACILKQCKNENYDFVEIPKEKFIVISHKDPVIKDEK